MPFRAEVGADTWQLRLNDFPAEHLYTLLVNGSEIDGFDDWPKSWKRPLPGTRPSKKGQDAVGQGAAGRTVPAAR
ncbi:MAG: hypothetical protein EXQ47_01320 [Bryobacterales bacterium]|nr:hypothetical protein [Bryobacterales bacterium]